MTIRTFVSALLLLFFSSSALAAKDVCMQRQSFISKNCDCAMYKENNCQPQDNYQNQKGEGSNFQKKNHKLCEKCCCIGELCCRNKIINCYCLYNKETNKGYFLFPICRANSRETNDSSSNSSAVEGTLVS